MTDEQFEDFLRTTLKRDAKPADADAVDRVLSATAWSAAPAETTAVAVARRAAQLGFRAGLAAHGSSRLLRGAWLLSRHCRT